MDASGDEATQNNAVLTENMEKSHNDEEFFEDPSEFDGEMEEGNDFRCSPGRGGFR